MPNKLVIIQRGESLPFKFDRGGASIEDWVCVITVKQRPDDIAEIQRTISSDDDQAFSGFLSSTETLNLVEGLWYLTGTLTNASTDELEEIPVRFRVTKSWLTPSKVAFVTFFPLPGQILQPTQIFLSTIAVDATIRFTTDGSEPTANSPIFFNPIDLPLGDTTIRAFAAKIGFENSDITASNYGVFTARVDPVTFLPVAGTIGDTTPIALATITAGATIHFTTDGTAATTESPEFMGPFTLPIGNQTVKAIAVKVDLADSFETQAIYTVQDVVENVTFSPPAGNISETTLITLATITPLATIFYTTDGSPPTTGSTEFVAPFTLTEGVKTVKAFAVKVGFSDSAVTEATYTVAPAFPTILNLFARYDLSAPGVTVTGTGISLIPDLSPFSHNLLQTDDANRPSYNQLVIPFADFNGTTDFMETANFTEGVQDSPNTIVIIFRFKSFTPTQWVYDGLTPSDNQELLVNAGPVLRASAGSGENLSTVPDTNKHNVALVFDGASSRGYVDGGTDEIVGNLGSDGQGKLVLAAQNGGSFNADIEVYEMVMYDRALNNSELNELGNYFAGTQAITYTDIV